MKKIWLLPALLSAFLAGCTTYPSVGAKQGETPPQIVVKKDSKTWDNPGAFGPVPEELKSAGAAVCSSLDTDKVKHEARGYHANALNLEGKPFKGGGYYCVPTI